MAVEIIFSLPIDRHDQDTRPFFIDCLDWVKLTFPGELLSFDVHLDEAAPHAHAVILPLIDNKMQGNKLIGNTGNLMRLINQFHADVARYYGLSRSPTERLSTIGKEALGRDVLIRLKSDPLMRSKVWPVVRDDISKDPLKYAQQLGLEPRQDRAGIKSFIDYKRQAGKGSFER